MVTDEPVHDQKGTAMTETQTLLGKIAALRQRLEQAQKLASEANSAAQNLFGAPAAAVLERRIAEGAEHDAALRRRRPHRRAADRAAAAAAPVDAARPPRAGARPRSAGPAAPDQRRLRRADRRTWPGRAVRPSRPADRPLPRNGGDDRHVAAAGAAVSANGDRSTVSMRGAGGHPDGDRRPAQDAHRRRRVAPRGERPYRGPGRTC